MRKMLIVVAVLAIAAGIAYAADTESDKYEPISTFVNDTGETIKTAAEGTVETLDLTRNPIVTATDTTVKTAQESVKTVTFRKIDPTKSEE